MVKVRGNGPIPYVILGTDHAQNLRFYERYDEHFLFNKVATFLYILDEGEPAIKQIEERLVANGGGSLAHRELEGISEEEFFIPLHPYSDCFPSLFCALHALPQWRLLTGF